MNIRSKSIRIALLVGAGLGCGSAWALPPAGLDAVTRTETVKYRPSEVASAGGAAKLYARLQVAARKVCEDPSPQATRVGSADPAFVACVREALDHAVQQLGLPMVTTLHRYGGRAPAMASR